MIIPILQMTNWGLVKIMSPTQMIQIVSGSGKTQSQAMGLQGLSS